MAAMPCDLSNLSSDDLVVRIQGGDSAARAELIERCRPVAAAEANRINLAYRAAGSGMDDDDLAQEAIISVIRAVDSGRLRQDANVDGYLRLAARTGCLMAIRGKERFEPMLPSAECSDTSGSSPDDLSGEVSAAMDQLTLFERRLVRERSGLGESGKVASWDLLSMQTGLSRMKLQRAWISARSRLRAALDKK